MKYIFTIPVDDVQRIAKEKMGRELNSDELYQVQKGVEFGLECCWEDVVGYAIDDLKYIQQNL
ncbi:MAG: hypothetical protein QME51_10285 [Planctomycetota bacterium]|nr:hypothetical protein [Planctomycetota bacterium]